MKTLLTLILFLTLVAPAFAAKFRFKDMDAFQKPVDPLQVPAWQASLPPEFQPASRLERLGPGDWIMRAPEGYIFLMKDADFQRAYQ